MSKEKITEEQFFDSGKVIKNGVEWPESTPVELPIGYSHPPTIQEMLATMVRQELQMRDEMDPEKEVEREEDFEMDEDEGEELLTPGELHYMAAQERERLVREGHDFRSGKKERVQGDGESGAVRQGKGFKDVSGPVAGGGASPVRSVGDAEASGEERPGGDESGPRGAGDGKKVQRGG